MKLLILETSSSPAQLVLSVDGQIFTDRIDEPRAQAKHFFPKLDALLKTAGLSLSDLDGLAMGHGPGSFVGLRVATAVLQTFSLVHELPVVTFSSLRAWAQSAFEAKQFSQVNVCMNAYMGEYYVGEYALDESVMRAVIEDHLLKTADANFEHAKVVVGDTDLSTEQIVIEPKALAALAQDEFLAKRLRKADELSPVYLRGKEAWGT